MADPAETPAALRTLIVDDEPLAVERIQVICADIDAINVVGTASDGAAALRLVEALTPRNGPSCSRCTHGTFFRGTCPGECRACCC